MNQLEFDLELNGNKRHISVEKDDDGSYAVKLDKVATAVLKHQDSCWLQLHGSKLPQHFIDQIGAQLTESGL